MLYSGDRVNLPSVTVVEHFSMQKVFTYPNCILAAQILGMFSSWTVWLDPC